MKVFISILSIIVSFFIIVGFRQTAYAFDVIQNMQVNPLTDRVVVVSWDTTNKSSSKVRFTTQLYGESESPDYATHTTAHQVKVDGIIPGLTYRFFAESTDENGDTTISDPLVFVLPTVGSAVADQSAPVDDSIETTNPSLTFADLLKEARNYTGSQVASTGFAFLTFILTAAIFLAEETTWWLFFDWLLAFGGLHVWHGRKQKNTFRVLDSRTSRPIPGAEISILIGGQVVQTFHSNESGDVLFSWPIDKPIEVRISRKGFHSLDRTFVSGLDDVALDPLFAPMAKELFPSGFLFSLKHSLKMAHLIILILGTCLLIPSFLAQPSLLTALTGAAYLFLWLLYFFSLPHRFHMVQVVDAATRQPIPFARINGHGSGSSRHYITDRSGLARLIYPLPSVVSIHKKGYRPILDQALSATSIAPDILILELQSLTVQSQKEADVPVV